LQNADLHPALPMTQLPVPPPSGKPEGEPKMQLGYKGKPELLLEVWLEVWLSGLGAHVVERSILKAGAPPRRRLKFPSCSATLGAELKQVLTNCEEVWLGQLPRTRTFPTHAHTGKLGMAADEPKSYCLSLSLSTPIFHNLKRDSKHNTYKLIYGHAIFVIGRLLCACVLCTHQCSRTCIIGFPRFCMRS